MKRGATKNLRVAGILLVLFFLFSAFALLPQPVRAVNTVTATVTVGSKPTGVAVAPNGGYAYVTNAGGTTVSVIGTATTASPTPKVPEFSDVALVSVAVAIAVVTLCAIAFTARTRKRLRD